MKLKSTLISNLLSKTHHSLKFFVLPLCALLYFQSALAFPEMVRHGYVNCTACHVSPSGGGALTPYGRELSREILSTWGREKEPGFAYNWFQKSEPKESLRTGGDIRIAQVYRENPRTKRATLIPMQADVEAGVDDGKHAAVVAVGLRAGERARTRDLNQFFSRRHYFLTRPTEQSSIRVGKFMKSYGLNIADHIVSIRRDLGWDYGNESYNLEYANLGEKYSYYLTLVSDDPEETRVVREHGAAATGSIFLWEDSKVGFSYYYGRGANTVARDVFGPYWILSLTHKLFWMTEFDWQLKAPLNAERTSGYVAFSRVYYEAFKGFLPFAQVDVSNLNLEVAAQKRQAYGIGLQWFPRPHWEVMGLLSQEKLAGSKFDQFHWLMLHFYL